MILVTESVIFETSSRSK